MKRTALQAQDDLHVASPLPVQACGLEPALLELDAILSFGQGPQQVRELFNRMAHDLRESETRFRQLAENIHEVFFLVNHDHTQMLYVNPAYEEIWGRSCESLYAAPQSWEDCIYPDDKEQAFKDSRKRDAMGRFDFEFRIVRPDGQIRSIRARGFPIPNEAGETYRFAGIAEDITEQKAQTRRIARFSRLYAVLSGINSAIMRIHDRKELFQEACRVAVNQGGFSLAWIGVIDPVTLNGEVVAWFGGDAGYMENIGLTARAGTPFSNRPASVAVREMRPVVCNALQANPAMAPLGPLLLASGYQSAAAWPIVTGDRASAVIVLLSSEPDFFDEEESRLLDDLARDLVFGLQFIDKEEKLRYLAYYDVLTGLPNGALFYDRLTQLLHCARHDHHIAAVIVIDLQHFTHLNDAMGRHAGDDVLREVAHRLGAALREPFSLARTGGDTFAIALGGLRHVTDIVPLLEQQIFESFSRPFTVNRQEVRVAIQAGLALYPNDGDDAETLFRRAEFALKNAKSSGERILYYAPQMNATIATRLALENELRLALEEGQFVMHYQPRVDLLSGRIVSAEALIRWQHPQRGLLPPAQFIPLAEESGLIVPIGAWVIETVCAQQAAWRDQHVEIVSVAINLSAIQFQEGQVLRTICNAIAAHGLEQKYIEFELTESAVMQDPDEASHHLLALKNLGMRLSLDDFGTGYSSLAYLKRFPFDFVKIDRTFITEVTTNPDDAAIATAVIAMAHSLNLRVVAEGVETLGQLQFLRKHRCDELQGYYFSPAVPADEFAAMLREGKRLSPEEKQLAPGNTVLIVDDEPNILSALNRVLRREGYRVLSATSGAEGLKLLAENAVQVIVSDQRMPGMDGSEFLGIVKNLYPDTIRIILSGYSDLKAVTDSVNRGAVFKFLTKPWDDELLREHIRDAFRRYRP